MPRHRGKYNPDNPEPYEISRGKVENFIKCKACFWLDRVGGVHFPSIPGFNINSNTDTLLKRDFDQYRGKSAHPFMIANGVGHLKPFAHDDIKKWESALHFGSSPNHFNCLHKETNLRFGGGLDDVWVNPADNVLYIVDYKSTANLSADPKPVSLDGRWKAGYKRQMEMYQFIMRAKGFEVSNTGYFVYVDGQHLDRNGMIDRMEPSEAWMLFNTSLLEYEGDDSWVEPALYEIRELLESTDCPKHSDICEHGIFLREVEEVALSHAQSTIPMD